MLHPLRSSPEVDMPERLTAAERRRRFECLGVRIPAAIRLRLDQEVRDRDVTRNSFVVQAIEEALDRGRENGRGSQ
jgi:hypothetical protein